MAIKLNRLQFEGAPPEGIIRILSDRINSVELTEGQTTVVNLARVMTFRDQWYGKVELTRKKFASMIDNFKANTYGQDIFIDVSHQPSNGAAATIKRLFMEGTRFLAEVEWTEFGIDAVKKRGFKYLSIDFTEEYVDPETEKEHGPLLFGSGLTIRPRVKRLNPVELSFKDDEQPVLLTLYAKKLLSEESEKIMEKYLEELRKQLSELQLSEKVIGQYATQFETVAKQLSEDETALNSLVDAFVATGKQLSESDAGSNENIKLDFSGLNIQPGTGLSEKDVRKILTEEAKTKDDSAKKLQEDLGSNVKRFTDAIAAAEGLKQLSEEQMTKILSAKALITAEMTSEQVTAQAEHEIARGNELAVNMQLGSLGYHQPGAAGSLQISVDDSNSIRKLSEDIATGLRATSHHATGKIVLAQEEKLPAFCQQVLAEFDRVNARRLFEEAKQFAGGETGIADTSLPAGFQRTVIREALSDFRVLELVQTLTDFSATATTDIPYESRDSSGVLNDGVVYEGQDIHEASVSQEMDLAYILPMKLAFLITNEVMHFTRASAINWDAYARNLESNARIVRELIVRRICNEMQRSADAYQAVTNTDEDFGSQLDGTTVSIIKTTNYPIVRPHQQKDLKGNNVGTAENPISIQINSVAIAQYDGSNTQSSGTYYRVTNYNLGYVQFVSELGVAVFPAATGNNEFITYGHATNVAKFDLDTGTTELGLHLNGLLRAFGERKALMAQDRFVVPDFLLMSHTLNNTATNANNFEVDSKRDGTDTNKQGDLDRIKSINAWSTNAPGIDLGDERAIMGQRGVLTYTIAKPFVTGQPVEAVNPTTGKLIGKKKAYGEEYSAIKVPTPVRERLTSVIAYSFTGR